MCAGLVLGLRGGQGALGTCRRLWRQFGGPFEEGGCRGQAAARLGAAGRPFELRGDRLVRPGRRLGAVPGAAIGIDLRIGRPG